VLAELVDAADGVLGSLTAGDIARSANVEIWMMRIDICCMVRARPMSKARSDAVRVRLAAFRLDTRISGTLMERSDRRGAPGIMQSVGFREGDQAIEINIADIPIVD